MSDNVVSLLQVIELKGKKGDAAVLLNVSRLIQQISDEEIKEKMADAWRKATIAFLAASF